MEPGEVVSAVQEILDFLDKQNFSSREKVRATSALKEYSENKNKNPEELPENYLEDRINESAESAVAALCEFVIRSLATSNLNAIMVGRNLLDLAQRMVRHGGEYPVHQITKQVGGSRR